MSIELCPIAHIKTDFPTKFGLPRQSGLAKGLKGTVVFEPQFASPEAVRGLEGFSHIWLIWVFSEVGSSLTVRPPRLGGNKRMGVFATRSPFRPNPLGLSCVRLEGIDYDEKQGLTLAVSGIDLMDGTPIVDIKPYLPLADCQPAATGGFAAEREGYSLEVEIPPQIAAVLGGERAAALGEALAQDPRPAYHDDPERVYGFEFSGFEIKFYVSEGRACVISAERSGD